MMQNYFNSHRTKNQEEKEAVPSLSCLVNSANLSFPLLEANVGGLINPFGLSLSEKPFPSQNAGERFAIFNPSVCRGNATTGELRDPGGMPPALGLRGFTMPPITQAWVDLIDQLETKYGVFEWFGSFTFAEPLHPEQANKRFLRLTRVLSKAVSGNRYYKHGTGISWVRGTESQKRDAIHYHAFFGNGVRKLRRLDFMDIWQSPEIGGGYCRIWPYDGRINAKSYIVKYQLKGGEIDVYIPPSLTNRLI